MERGALTHGKKRRTTWSTRLVTAQSHGHTGSGMDLNCLWSTSSYDTALQRQSVDFLQAGKGHKLVLYLTISHFMKVQYNKNRSISDSEIIIVWK